MATTVNSAGPSSIPYSRAIKYVPAIRPIGEPNLNSDAAIGNTSPDTLAEMPSSSVAVKIAGRDASDERVLNPMT